MGAAWQAATAVLEQPDATKQLPDSQPALLAWSQHTDAPPLPARAPLPPHARALLSPSPAAHLDMLSGPFLIIKGEVPVGVHVVDVCPNSVQGQPCSAVVGHHLLHLPDGLVPIPAKVQMNWKVSAEGQQALWAAGWQRSPSVDEVAVAGFN